MRLFVYLLSPVFLTGCLFWELMPSYSSYWDEDTWIHKNTKQPLSNDIHTYCFYESLKGFEVKDVSGYQEVIGAEDKKKSKMVYTSCLRRKGFIFNASYKYCYKFREVCTEYSEYRK